jgi:hypothetical protein
MDRVIYFPEQGKRKMRRSWLKRNGIPLLCLLLFCTLIYQLLSGFYQLYSYNRRLKEGETLLQEKKLYLEELERRLQRSEPDPEGEIILD